MDDSLPNAVWATLQGFVTPELTQRTFNAFSTIVQRGATEVHLLVQSFGGNVGDAVSIYNVLRNLPLTITTYNTGHIASSAVAIYLCGERRVTEPTAAFLLHRTANQPPVALQAPQLAALARSTQLDEDRLNAIVKQHAKLTRVQWRAVASSDLTLDADHALKCGLAHSCGSFAPPHGAPFFNI